MDQLQSSVTEVSYTPASATFDQVKLGFGSIMEEIEEVVPEDSLPSPICRKKIRKMSVSGKKMKNIIVEMVMYKVNDTVWLQQFDTNLEVGIAAVLEVERERFEEENSAMDEKFAFMDTHLVLYRLGWTFVILLFPLLIFTFLGGLEIEYNLYYPFTWHMLRYFYHVDHQVRLLFLHIVQDGCWRRSPWPSCDGPAQHLANCGGVLIMI